MKKFIKYFGITGLGLSVLTLFGCTTYDSTYPVYTTPSHATQGGPYYPPYGPPPPPPPPPPYNGGGWRPAPPPPPPPPPPYNGGSNWHPVPPPPPPPPPAPPKPARGSAALSPTAASMAPAKSNSLPMNGSAAKVTDKKILTSN